MLKAFNDLHIKYRNKLLAVSCACSLLYSMSNKPFYISIMFATAGPLFFLDVMSIIYLMTSKEKDDSQ